jgi:hypothetical protein
MSRVLAALVLVYVIWLLVLSFAPVQAAPPSAPRPQVIEGKYAPIAIYDPRERALTVTAAAPRETLVCLRDQCKLVEEWIGK